MKEFFNKKRSTKHEARSTILPLIALTTITAAILIIFYCDLFYDFGLIAKERIMTNPFLIFVATPFFFWVSAYLCRHFAVNASGSNLRHIRMACEQLQRTPDSYEKISSFLGWRVILVNLCSSLISAFGGGSLGREGSSVQISAGIFAGFADKFRKFSPKISPNISLESWVFAGCGVGLAIAFNSPFAGLVYVMEKLYVAKWRNFIPNFVSAFFALIFIAIILFKAETIFILEPLDLILNWQIFYLFFLAIICGIAAFYFLKICNFFYDKFSAIKSAKWHLVPVICGLVVAFVSFYGGVYSIGGGIKTVNDALANSGILLSSTEVFGRIISTILTFISGCAGGLVMPAIAIGASIGSIFTGLFSSLGIKIFILGGMAAFLSPVLGMPLTAAVVILQSTAQPLIFLPLLLLLCFVSDFVKKICLITPKPKK
ncbi:MAG: hypothetical protein A2887_06950 [Alphaproteobacteria bacterium RIFCSPLOWO2_01_FULL_40_26]|nr:MAG: hypothetical protein A3D15_02820 [Alphaproteobacteria bacterium RIFCSPHIGHO2_02_FULL_40_34]OFW87564.1 MAG: hypothetical protein A2794_00580 [Alphaproteobacteria bacterium RIFCSPHIGHO2_01_FULL_40_8]OFW95571.1 MAG: hypothetical protein A2887_06950 [Alphaproteobacteria bacterium RIFCSPLOWO2_01_FULL_40_26]OFX10598.1 MAG: hypothetical protein A3H30_01650 [Alphaproteobacteria bacterium RIFCSPLOWO2_02_FULL_40_19]OFX12307.1 MAG: hypothetical protein A3G22_06415 [Alphaproteobacteria bacterium RI